MQGDLIGRNDPRLEPTRSTDPRDIPTFSAQPLGYRQSGINMPTGSAGHNHHAMLGGGHADFLLAWTVLARCDRLRSSFSNTPTIMQLMNRLLPP